MGLLDLTVEVATWILIVEKVFGLPINPGQNAFVPDRHIETQTSQWIHS